MSRRRKLEILMAGLLLAVSCFLVLLWSESGSSSLNAAVAAWMQPSDTEAAGASAYENEIVVVLDPGHGARDSGKVGINDVYEKDINLAIALYLKTYLEEQGVRVVMTRTDDSPLYQETDANMHLADLKKRIQIITESKPAMVVSIHQNSYPQSNVRGAQVFYYTNSKEGEKLAAAVQKGFDYALGDKNTRGIKANKDYYLLVQSPAVAVICECGFLTNPEEAELLNTPEYQEKVARSISNGIIAYINGE